MAKEKAQLELSGRQTVELLEIAAQSADASVLAQLATHPNQVVRARVAMNPKSTAAILDMLKADSSTLVRNALKKRADSEASNGIVRATRKRIRES